MRNPVITGDREPKPLWQARRVCAQLTETATASLLQTVSLVLSLQYLDWCRVSASRTGRSAGVLRVRPKIDAGTSALDLTVLDSGSVGVRSPLIDQSSSRGESYGNWGAKVEPRKVTMALDSRIAFRVSARLCWQDLFCSGSFHFGVLSNRRLPVCQRLDDLRLKRVGC